MFSVVPFLSRICCYVFLVVFIILFIFYLSDDFYCLFVFIIFFTLFSCVNSLSKFLYSHFTSFFLLIQSTLFIFFSFSFPLPAFPPPLLSPSIFRSSYHKTLSYPLFLFIFLSSIFLVTCISPLSLTSPPSYLSQLRPYFLISFLCPSVRLHFFPASFSLFVSLPHSLSPQRRHSLQSFAPSCSAASSPRLAASASHVDIIINVPRQCHNFCHICDMFPTAFTSSSLFFSFPLLLLPSRSRYSALVLLSLL